ncbi:MAG: 30S ribosomal protein S1 [Candidatus Latescibacteria bacterium]|nr:30S ribosomal protein S1 [bacterium]MBD3423788.1 30S ribosomal protein S1 [Candidatus Latescibacterota bacterium]
MENEISLNGEEKARSLDPGMKEGDNSESCGKLGYLEDDDEFEVVSAEELEKELEEEILEYDPDFDKEIKAVDLKEGKIVRGKVYRITGNEVILDIGFKSEGTIPIEQFENCSEVKTGDEFDVFLEKMENQDGLVVLSKSKSDFIKAWDDIKESYKDKEIVTTTVDRRIKGGLMVKLLGVDAFLPGSQVALRQIPNLEELIGEDLEVRIIKINKRRRNIVVSRRVVLEEIRKKKKETLLSELEVGQVREGVVKNITDFGAFVDLGGIDGLLHLTDLTWGRISHPSEVVALGDELKVKILDFDLERERISLGLKQLTPYPWEDVEKKYSVGKTIKGKVVSITDYGAFVELEKGVEGLIHISEMSWTRHVKHPSNIVGIGDNVEAVVLNIDKENEKISLGLKQLEPDPWKSLEKKYSPGTKLKGKVRNLTNFGAFVEIEDGIDGLVHISDMSWAKRVRHPSEVLKKGQDIDVVVLNIDSEKRRISLGVKQIQENPWTRLAEEFSVGTETSGKITRLLNRGAVVEIKDNVEGFVPISHMGIEGIRKVGNYFDTGDELPLEVIKMDPQKKKIVLSVNAFFEGKDRSELQDFIEAHPSSGKEEEGAGDDEGDDYGEGMEDDEYGDYDDEDEVTPDKKSEPQDSDDSSPEDEVEAEDEDEEKPPSGEDDVAGEEKPAAGEDEAADEKVAEEESTEGGKTPDEEK